MVGVGKVGGREKANFKAQAPCYILGLGARRVSETCLENGISLQVTLSNFTMEISPFLRII